MQNLDPWGKPINETTNEELNKLRKEILNEGINKKSYSSEEESGDDSDNEMLMKFIPKKSKKSNEFESIGYAFTLNNKISKLRSELARNEERMRYLQLDYNNKEIKIDEQQIVITEKQIVIDKKEIIILEQNDDAKKYIIFIKSQNNQIKVLFSFNIILVFINVLQYILYF
jgi:hypothetical protein